MLYQIALWTAASYLPDAQRRLAAVPASAYDKQLHEWQVREALARSDWNGALAAIRRMPGELREDAHWSYFEARLLELTGAYATLARGGNFVPIESFLEVSSTDQPSLYRTHGGMNGQQVVDHRAVYQLLHVLGDPGARLVTFGTQTPLNLDRPHMVKTGTTDNHRDTWTVGFTPNLVIGVWVGNTDGHPMREVLSSMSAGKIWHEAMEESFGLLGLPVEDFVRPDGLVDVPCSGAGCARDLVPVERATQRPPARR